MVARGFWGKADNRPGCPSCLAAGRGAVPRKWCRNELYFWAGVLFGPFSLYYGIIPVTRWLTSVA